MAATCIGGFAILWSGVLEVRAEPQVETALHQLHAKADRLPVVVKGAACSTRGWPHYEQKCQFDRRRPAGDVQTVRIIAVR
jgi:hypothetical protein